MLEESLQVGISFIEVMRMIKDTNTILGVDSVKDDEWTTISIIQTALNSGTFVKLLHLIAEIPTLSFAILHFNILGNFIKRDPSFLKVIKWSFLLTCSFNLNH
jgi:hypothetical protein